MRLHLAAICLTAASPLALAQQPPPSFAPSNLTSGGVRAMAANCASCHGTLGRASPQATLPGLAGRSRDELVGIMAQFKSGKRPATVMHQIAKGYSDEEIAAMAEYFSRQTR
jgi:cytochrome c553